MESRDFLPAQEGKNKQVAGESPNHFVDTQKLIHVEWVPHGQTVNKKYYLTVLKRFREKMRKKRLQQ